MDLLNMHDNKVYKDIMEALNGLNISSEDIGRAEKFFDFSQDMDLSILDGIGVYEFQGTSYYTQVNAFNRLIDEDEKEYTKRYILFLDAIGGNTIGHILAYNFESMYTGNNRFAHRILDAYESRYDHKYTKMKIFAIMAQQDIDNIVSQRLIYTAKNNPEILYEAGKNYCTSKYSNAKLKLYAYALAYTKPEDKQNFLDKLKSLVVSSPESDAIKEMTDYILDRAEANQSDSEIMKFIMPIMFMSINHSEAIKSFLQKYIQGKEMKFLKVLYTNLPISYFESNVDKVFEMAVDGHVDGYATDCIKQAVKCGRSSRMVRKRKLCFMDLQRDTRNSLFM